MNEIHEVYKEDTVGRRYHVPIVSKKMQTKLDDGGGEIICINLNKRMSKQEFSRLSDSMKAMYIRNLNENYGASKSQIAETLGYSSRNMSNIISKLGLKSLFKRGRQSKRDAELWEQFTREAVNSNNESINQELTLSNATNSDMVSVENKENTISNAKEQGTELSQTKLSEFSFVLRGKLRAQDIAERIHAMVADGTMCSIVVSVALNEHGV